jgi:hypothetical protein
MAINPVKYIVVLIVVFGMIHLLVTLFHEATELPEWLTPRLAAMWATFFVALLWMLNAMNQAPIR